MTVDQNQHFAKIVEQVSKSASPNMDRTQPVQIVAVSKKQAVPKMQEWIDFCQRAGIPAILGENYLQEYQSKSPALQGQFEVHYIGVLQSNKVKKAVEMFDVIQTVHSDKLARLIDQAAKEQDKLQRIYLQVNISKDLQKSGFEIADLLDFLNSNLPKYQNLQLDGLMTITEFYEDRELVRPDFKSMASLREELCIKFPHLTNSLKLSMGMTADFEIAIEAGADLVRIGTGLFGER